MLRRLPSWLTPQASRCGSPDLDLTRSFQSSYRVKRQGKFTLSSQVTAGNSPVSAKNTYSLGSAAARAMVYSPEMGFENLPIRESRHRGKCYALFQQENDDSNEYSDYEERG